MRGIHKTVVSEFVLNSKIQLPQNRTKHTIQFQKHSVGFVFCWGKRFFSLSPDIFNLFSVLFCVHVTGFQLVLSKMAEGQDGCTNQPRVVPPCSPQLSHPSLCTPTWPSSGHRYEDDDDNAGGHPANVQSKEPPPCGLYEELFCTNQPSVPLVPLAGALMATSRPQADVVKGGYLGKLEQNHRRYFVLRAGSHTGPSRLEWYRNQEKFTAMEKSAGKSPLSGSNKQGLVKVKLIEEF